MKKLLLTSAIVAVSAASFAEITWSGDAEIGIRTHSDDGWKLGVDEKRRLVTGNPYEDSGFYFKADLNATASATLDSGITAELDYGFNLDYGIDAGDHDTEIDHVNVYGDPVALDSDQLAFDRFPTLTLTSSVGTLKIGEAQHAAFGEVTKYSDLLDNYFDENGDDGDDMGLVARADTTVAGFGLAVSTALSDNANLADKSGIVAFSGSEVAVGDFSIAATGDLMGVSGVLAYETRGVESSVAGIAKYTWNGIYGSVGVASTAIDLNDDEDLDADARIWAVKAGYQLEGIELGAEIANTKLNVRGTEADYLGYKLTAGFELYGADVLVTYEDENTDYDTDYDKGLTLFDQGFAIDAAYEVLPGVKVLAGYDQTEMQLIGDNKGKYGAAYVGTSYDLGSGASVFGSWSNGDEVGKPEYNVGTTMGLKLKF